MNELRRSVYSSVRDISQDQWETVWPEPAEGYSFYLSQETAGLEGFQFLYLVFRSGDAIVLIAPLFIAAFDFRLALEGVGQTILGKIQRLWPRFMVTKTLFCGSPVTLKGVIGVHPDYRGDFELFSALDRALVDLAKEHQAKMIVFKDFIDSDLGALTPLRALSYFVADGYPTAVLRIDFSSMDEYFSRLTYATRKDLRRKIKKTSARGGLVTEVVNNIDNYIDQIYKLYLNMYDASTLRFERLTREFFLNFCRYMPAQTRYFIYRVDNKVVGFNFCLVREDALVDKYIGLDRSVGRDYNLYYVSFLNNVRWCLENGKKYYLLGQGGKEMKSRLGAELIPLRGLTKFVNPVINPLVGFIASRMSKAEAGRRHHEI